MQRVLPHNGKAPDGDPSHYRRQQSPFLLSGLFYCGLCGYVMSGQRYGPIRCSGQQSRQLDCPARSARAARAWDPGTPGRGAPS
ncbi:MAG: zinc ribbon domain-containing protein [Acidobacteriota bacterium]